jgi:hypothetical protein
VGVSCLCWQHLEIGIAGSRRQSLADARERPIGWKAARGEASENVKGNSERATRRRILGERAHAACINSLTYCLGASLDLIARRAGTSRSDQQSLDARLSIGMLIDGTRDVCRGNASRRELESALLERFRGKSVLASIGDHRKHVAGDVRRQHLLQTYRWICRNVGRLCRNWSGIQGCKGQQYPRHPRSQ